MPPSTNHLALLLLSITACEHADTLGRPQTPARSTAEPAPAPEPAPVAEPEPAPPPAIARPEPEQPLLQRLQIDTKTFDETLVERRCMSRAGCRWEKDPLKPRVVVKKPAPETTTATKPEPK